MIFMKIETSVWALWIHSQWEEADLISVAFGY